MGYEASIEKKAYLNLARLCYTPCRPSVSSSDLEWRQRGRTRRFATLGYGRRGGIVRRGTRGDAERRGREKEEYKSGQRIRRRGEVANGPEGGTAFGNSSGERRWRMAILWWRLQGGEIERSGTVPGSHDSGKESEDSVELRLQKVFCKTTNSNG
jgi:hypothetical protein